MAAAFNKFEVFITDLAAGSHVSALNADTDDLMIYLSNAVPSPSLDTVRGELAEIANGNGYTTNGEDTGNAATTTAGVISVAPTNDPIVWTCVAAAMATFQYVVLYNFTATSRLIGWWDYGSPLTLQVGETFTVDFGATLFTVGS